MAMGDAYDVGQRVGLAFSIFAIGALSGPPISGAINAATGGFEAVGCYAGASTAMRQARY
jgi:MCP family monocarboxylic acid transporter-like MFS transporter 10